MGTSDFEKRFGKYFAPLPDKNAYLKRIGLDGKDIPLTKEGLDMLQFAHLCAVPFENLDLFDYNVRVDFGTEEMFDKVVTRRRGGYCFELNSIFMTLLGEVGFTVHPVGVRIRMSDFIPAIAHRGTIVTIGGKRYFSDVGFGMTNAPGFSVCIDDYGEQNIRGDIFSVEDRLYNNINNKVILRHTDEGKSDLFMFVPEPFNVLDFIAYNNSMQITGFRVKRIVNLRKPDGSISVDGGIFRRTVNKERTETPLAKAEDAFKIITDEYGMILTQPLGEIADKTV
ncbi:MAG: arylamine N-acetyltransferase [Treponema sp.]|jgi:N-hydroxyarylamine O-acetyltransferase|nr:arylamine N-acetyltransferase [Treponema sp.]